MKQKYNSFNGLVFVKNKEKTKGKKKLLRILEWLACLASLYSWTGHLHAGDDVAGLSVRRLLP